MEGTDNSNQQLIAALLSYLIKNAFSICENICCEPFDIEIDILDDQMAGIQEKLFFNINQDSEVGTQ